MFAGKTALITGSTSGIGLAIAKALAQQNANIVLNGFAEKEEIDKLCKEVSHITQGKVDFHGANMAKSAEINSMMKEIASKFGGVDILVNNVGIQFVHPLEDFPDDKWEAIIAINLSAAFYTTKAAFSYMKEKKWGRIINISSAHGLVASPFKCAYVSAKHGLIGLTKVAALEGGTFGITCNAICPGYTWTPLVANQIKDTAQAKGIPEEEVINSVLLAEHATKKFTTVEQLAALAIFLCSDLAENMTGTAIPVDGGWVAH